MDADTDNHGEEGIVLPGVDAHIMKMVIIQNSVIYPFTGSAVVVDALIFLCSPWDRGIETDVPVRFCIDTASVGRGRTVLFTGTGIHFAAGERAAPLAGMLLFAVSPVDHAETGHAQRGAVTVNGDGVRDGIRAPAVIVEVDKGTYLPFLAQPVGGIVVMGRIQADIPDRDIRVKGLEFPEGDDGADAVMPPGIQESDMEGQVNAGLGIMRAEHVKGMPEIIDFLFTVPSPVGIRVREMAFTGTAWGAVFPALTDFMPIRGGMGMDAGAVTGKGKAALGDEAVFHGGQDGGKAEKALEPLLEMEREFFVAQCVGGHLVRNTGMLIGQFFPFSGFFRGFSVPVLWEKVFPAGALGGFALSPEPVHEVKIRAQRREGTGGSSQQGWPGGCQIGRAHV